MIQSRVIQAYEEEKARSLLPGYVPSYDDYDEEQTAEAAEPIPRTESQHKAHTDEPAVPPRRTSRRRPSAKRREGDQGAETFES